MSLMKGVYFIFDIYHPKPEVFCKVFKYNQSFIDITESNNLSPRTKHIAIKYNNFRSFLQKNIIRVWYIDTREQTEYILTKPLDEALFVYLRIKLSGWWLKNGNLWLDTRGYYNTKNEWFNLNGSSYL